MRVEIIIPCHTLTSIKTTLVKSNVCTWSGTRSRNKIVNFKI